MPRHLVPMGIWNDPPRSFRYMGRSGMYTELEAMEMTNDQGQADPGASTTVIVERIDIRAAASAAYRVLVRHVDDLALVVLHASEAAVLRNAADACLFDDDDAVERVAAACELLARLGEFGRLEIPVTVRLSEELVAVDCESRRLAVLSTPSRSNGGHEPQKWRPPSADA